MDWSVYLIGSLTVLLVLFMTGIPIFIAFLIISVAGVLIVAGPQGFPMVVNSIFDTTNTNALSAVPLFVLMGELLFRSGSVDVLFDSVDKVVGRIKGRQYVLSIILATIFGAVSGAAMAVAAMMARSLYPVMMRRGYDAKLSIGTIMAGACLAPIIPPSILVIIIGTVANVSIGGLLIAGVIPGLMLATMFLIYTLLRVRFEPSLAGGQTEEPPTSSAKEKLVAVARSAPFAIVIFSVMGFMLLGIATPTESAASGVLGAALTTALYKRLNLQMVRESLTAAAAITAMLLIIMASATIFSQLLAMTGVSGSMGEAVSSLGWSPWLMLFIMQLIPLILCMFVDPVPLMLLLAPIYSPLLGPLGFDPIWFWCLIIINMTVGTITPPFGYTMFAFKGAAPNVPISLIYSACWPFVAIFVFAMVLIALHPPLATFLPSLLR